MNCITAHCLVSDHTIRKNGKILFEDKSSDLPGFLLSAYQQLELNYPRFHKMDRLSRLGWLATEILLEGPHEPAGSKPPARPEDTGVVLTNANSSLDTDRKYWESAKQLPSPSLFVYTLPNIVIGEICIRNNFKGEGAFFITPSFDAGFLSQYVNNLLDNGILQTCICGWVDVLGEEYKAALFLAEKRTDQNTNSKTDPKTNPKANPGMTPGTNRKANSGTNPKTNPGTTNPGTTNSGTTNPGKMSAEKANPEIAGSEGTDSGEESSETASPQVFDALTKENLDKLFLG